MNCRPTLCLIVFQHIFARSDAVNGLIWSKSLQDFVRLYDIPCYASRREEYVSKIHELETHDFGGAPITASYGEERNIVVYYNNETQVTGILGDIWTLLAEYLNFKLVPVDDKGRFFGARLENGSFVGLLHEMDTNRIDVIFRSGFYSFRKDILQFTTPFWKTRFRLYIRPEWKYDNRWIITLLSPVTWYSVLFLFITLTVVGYILQVTVDKQDAREKVPHPDDYTLCDHLFFTFAMMCAQGSVPDKFHSRFKILSFSKSVFAWLVLLAFSTHLIYRMTNRTTTAPFNDIYDLFNRTKYTILSYKGSMIYDSFSRRIQRTDTDQKTLHADRVRFPDDPVQMYIKACYSKNPYAIFEVEDKFMASTRVSCPLKSVGRAYYETWISSGLSKNFKYKRAIDVAILKLHEVGLVDGLRDRWLEPKLVVDRTNTFKTIDIEQVYLVFMVLHTGIVASVIILILENIAFRRGWTCICATT